MPSTEWKMKNFHEKWYAGEVISVGIGQGAVTATPVQMARAIGGIASGGVLKRPHVVFPDDVAPDYRQAMLDFLSGERRFTSYHSILRIWEIITDAMAEVFEPGGTDPSAHLEGIDFAGKTGSAQMMSNTLASKMGHTSQGQRLVCRGSPRAQSDIVVCTLDGDRASTAGLRAGWRRR